MLLIVFLLLPCCIQGWHQCEVRYDIKSVMTKDEILDQFLPIGTDPSSCSVDMPIQPNYIPEDGFATRAYCDDECTRCWGDKICVPDPNLTFVLDTLTITCDFGLVVPIALKRPGGCKCLEKGDQPREPIIIIIKFIERVRIVPFPVFLFVPVLIPIPIPVPLILPIFVPFPLRIRIINRVINFIDIIFNEGDTINNVNILPIPMDEDIQCVRVDAAGPPPQMLPFMRWCKLLTGPLPSEHGVDCFEVNGGCPDDKPQCIPTNITVLNDTFECPPFMIARVCVDGSTALTFTCPAGSVVKVTDANYAADEEFATCPPAGSVDGNCKESVTGVIQGLCDGMESCTFTPSIGLLGDDPCPGVPKNIFLQYFCTPVVTVTGCESTNILISCPSNLTISVMKATYGRPHALTACPPGGAGEPNPVCSIDVTATVSATCDGQSNCTMLADTSTLGISDPCAGVADFLEVQIICTPIIAWWSIAAAAGDITEPTTLNITVPYHDFDCPEECIA